MEKLLLTGFQAFGNWRVNPTEEVASKLASCDIGSWSVSSVILPVTFSHCWPKLLAELQSCDYSAVVMLGLAGSRNLITPEATARNWVESVGRPDNLGEEMPAGPILMPGEDLPSTFGAEKMVAAMKQRGIGAEISHDAGSFVCNYLSYQLLKYLAGEGRGGFIHLPPTREMRPDSIWKQSKLIEAVELCIGQIELSGL